MLSRSPPGAPLRRSYVLVFALSALVFHVWLARRLGAVQAGLASTLGDDAEAPVSGGRGDDGRDLEGAEWRRLEGVRALLGIGKVRRGPHSLTLPTPRMDRDEEEERGRAG